MMSPINRIRNFTIIAHIDHGKTTLVDSILLKTSNNTRIFQSKERITDQLPVEQQRGITVKMQPLTIKYKEYTLNLIDTPGHIDFSYEVSRSLSAVEGAVLLVDATQGIQAQTIENLLKALEANLLIIPALSKVDAVPLEVIHTRIKEIESILGFARKDILLTSGKTGQGVTTLLETVISVVPPPKKTPLDHPKALVFDLHYDQHLGMVATIRVMSGEIRTGDIYWVVNEGLQFQAKEVGIFTPQMVPTPSLSTGMIGYIATGIKNKSTLHIGQTIGTQDTPIIPGYSPPKPKLFASIFPYDQRDYNKFKDAVEQLNLNDSALQMAPLTSPALGRGYKLGLLGTLHLEIVKERLAQEYGLDIITTIPNVEYKIKLRNGETIYINSPTQWPEANQISQIFEPIVDVEVITQSSVLSAVSTVLKQFRGTIHDVTHTFSEDVNIDYYSIKAVLPLSALIDGIFQKLMQASHGYASLSYSNPRYQLTQAVKVDILINKVAYPELSFLSHPSIAREKSLKILQALKQTLPRSVISIPLQAAINTKIIARETIPAYRKNVTAKLYGGDITRKMKLLRNQAKRKAIRKQHIKIKIPPHAFIRAIKMVNL